MEDPLMDESDQMLTRLDDPREVACDEVARLLSVAIEKVQGDPADLTTAQERRMDDALRARAYRPDARLACRQ